MTFALLAVGLALAGGAHRDQIPRIAPLKQRATPLVFAPPPL
jgi:hypothetical protein